DQRVADLMYGMLQMEVEPLDEKWLPLVKEAGFSGGVKVSESGGSTHILTGIHIWPVENIESLGQVLRKSDLVEFNPVKLYLLSQHYIGTDPSGSGYLTFHDD